MKSRGKPDFLERWVRRINRPLPGLTNEFLQKVIGRPHFHSFLHKYVRELEDLINKLNELYLTILDYIEARINYRMYTTCKNERRTYRKARKAAKAMQKFEEDLNECKKTMEIDMVLAASVDPDMYKLLSAHGTVEPPGQPDVLEYHSINSLDFESQAEKPEYRSMDSLNFESHVEVPEYHSMESLDFDSEDFVADL